MSIHILKILTEGDTYIINTNNHDHLVDHKIILGHHNIYVHIKTGIVANNDWAFGGVTYDNFSIINKFVKIDNGKIVALNSTNKVYYILADYVFIVSYCFYIITFTHTGIITFYDNGNIIYQDGGIDICDSKCANLYMKGTTLYSVSPHDINNIVVMHNTVPIIMQNSVMYKHNDTYYYTDITVDLPFNQPRLALTKFGISIVQDAEHIYINNVPIANTAQIYAIAYKSFKHFYNKISIWLANHTILKYNTRDDTITYRDFNQYITYDGFGTLDIIDRTFGNISNIKRLNIHIDHCWPYYIYLFPVMQITKNARG